MFKNIYRKKFPNPHAIVPPCSVKIITGQAVHSCFWLQEKTWEPVHCFSFTDLGFPMWNSVQQQHHHGRNRTVVEGRDRIIDRLCPPLTLFFIVAQNRHGWKAIFICFSAAFIGHQPEYKGEKKGRGGLSNDFFGWSSYVLFFCLFLPMQEDWSLMTRELKGHFHHIQISTEMNNMKHNYNNISVCCAGECTGCKRRKQTYVIRRNEQ